METDTSRLHLFISSLGQSSEIHAQMNMLKLDDKTLEISPIKNWLQLSNELLINNYRNYFSLPTKSAALQECLHSLKEKLGLKQETIELIDYSVTALTRKVEKLRLTSRELSIFVLIEDIREIGLDDPSFDFINSIASEMLTDLIEDEYAYLNYETTSDELIKKIEDSYGEVFLQNKKSPWVKKALHTLNEIHVNEILNKEGYKHSGYLYK